MHYYKRHITDYIGKCSHLTLLEHGTYIRLIDIYMQTEFPIRDYDKYRLIGARSKQEQAAVRDVLKEFFIQEGDFWVSETLNRELRKYHARDKANQENGSKGGRPKVVKFGRDGITQK